MATTGELRAIIQELQLVDAGDAASYLGEEFPDDELVVLPAFQFSCEVDAFATELESKSVMLL